MSHNVSRFLAVEAAEHPDKAAVRATLAGRTVERSFAELEAEAAAAVRLFRGRGIERGTRVLLMVRPGLDLIRVVFALFKLGAVPVVIDPGMGLKGFLACVRRSRPEALVGIPFAIGVSRFFPGSFRSLRARVRIDAGFSAQVGNSAGGGTEAAAESAADDLAAVLFTSGSTGPAKGVRYTHGVFEAQLKSIRRHYGIERGEVDLPMLPVFALFNPALGMTTVVPQMNPSRPAAVDPARIVGAILENRVTNSFGSPALWSKIAGYCEANGVTLPSVRRILMAGAPVPADLMRRMGAVIPEGRIHTPYGATEALPLCSIEAGEVIGETAAATAAGAGTCVGRPLAPAEVAVIRSVGGELGSMAAAELLPSGERGEIIARGPMVTRSYDNLPEATAAAKIADGDGFWHRMGDLGYFDKAGRLWFCGRAAERVDLPSGPLYTECCEPIFNAHPEVYRSALIGLPGDRAAIVVEPLPGCFPATASARERLAGELSALAASNPVTAPIRSFFFERRFPVDVRHNAKIHRLSLARKYARLHPK